MNTNKTNGVIYYKLDERYDGDITKNCGLTGGEVDSNFFFLRGYDVENIEWDDDNRQLIFKRINGETIIVKGLDTPISAEKTYYDAENGTLILNINGVDYPISGFYVKEEQKFYTGNSVNGDGTIKEPIEVSETLKTGFFAPVESFIDLTVTNNHLPSGVEHGTRFLTKENINKYGLLYNAEGLLKVQDILKNENSPWRVPSDKEWGEMLNALEELPENRNHINTYSNKLCGSMAGPLMKKGSYEWVEIKRSQNLDTNTIEVADLPEPSFIEYYECTEENKYYAVLDNPNTYIYYSCQNIWLNSNKVTPIYDIPQSCYFKVLPVGHAEVYSLTNKDSFRKQSVFWSSSEDENTDIWVREFAYDRDTVRRQAETVSDYFSIRLVRDYHSSVNKVENINGIPYETILMPYVEVDENGNVIKEGKKVWTSYNISIPSLLNYNEEGKYAVKPFNEKGEGIESDVVYFLNYWNGNSWEKRIFENNSMVIISNGPDGSKDEEWQLINGNLFKRSQEIISSLEKYTDKKISVLEEKHDSNIKDLQDTHNDDVNKITSLIEDYEAKTDELLTKLNEEIAERNNVDNTHNTQIDKLNQDIEVESKERIESDENLLNKINDVDSKLDEEVTKRGDDVLDLTNKINEETKNREEGDILLSNEITKNKIISIISNEKSINTSIAENESGTTLYLDVELSDNDGCEFLHHTKGGLSDKGIKEYIRITKDEIDSKHNGDIDEVKNNIVSVDDKITSTNTRVTTIESDYLTSSDKEELVFQIGETNRVISNIDSTYKLADANLKNDFNKKLSELDEELKIRINSIDSDITSIDGNYVNVRTIQNNGVITSINVVENDIASAKDLSDLTKRIDTFFSDADISSEAIDTLKEIQTYIDGDGNAAATMTTNIKKAQDAADAAQDDVDALEIVVNDNKTNIDNKITTLETNHKNDYDSIIKTINNEIEDRKEEDERIRGEYNSSLISTKSEIESAYELSDKALKEELDGKITSTNTRVTTIESDYLTSSDKSELISSNKVTSDKISEVEKNYLLADAELNKRLEVIEGGYALNSVVNSEIERAKSEEKRIETLVNSKLDSSIFNTEIQDVKNKVTTLTEKDEIIDNEISTIKENYTLKTSLNSEIARAEGAENELLLKINAESERAVSKENAIESLITNEVSRATSKENELNESIKEVKTLVGDNTVLSQINDVVNTLDFTDVAQSEMFVSEVQQENGKITKVGRLPFSGVTYIKDIRDEVDILKNDITEKAPISSVYTKDETNSTFVNKSQIVNTLGGSDNLIVSQKKINEEIDKLRSEIINSGTGGEVDLTTIYERLLNIESDIANINTLIESNEKTLGELTETMNEEISVRNVNDEEHSKQINEINTKLGNGTIITTNNITEYIVTPKDDENIVISKTENGGISIKLVKIDNINF